MKILLDTQCWLWMVATPERFSAETRARLADSGTEVFLSAASAWEIAIEFGLGRLALPAPPDRYIPDVMTRSRTSPLPVHVAHALRVAELPLHHRDPFDRMLIAQAQIETLPLLTADPLFQKYDVEVMNP